jgi:hypothetical protein
MDLMISGFDDQLEPSRIEFRVTGEKKIFVCFCRKLIVGKKLTANNF